MRIGDKEFNVADECYIMGILNVTPDSFSDGGRFNTIDSALKRVEVMIDEGADIIDIGGESTRPGYTKIPDEEEIKRIIPVIKEIKKRFKIPLSVDTYKSDVAREALLEGTDLINDIWGFKYDSDIAKEVAKAKAVCCLMHNRDEINENDIIDEVCEGLHESICIAKEAGVSEDKIILDPGVGFGKTLENNLQVINKLEELRQMGYPVLLGTSKKSVIGLTLQLPKYERIEGTLVTTVLAVMKGASFVRVHDVKENKRTIAMTKAIIDAV